MTEWKVVDAWRWSGHHTQWAVLGYGMYSDDIDEMKTIGPTHFHCLLHLYSLPLEPCQCSTTCWSDSYLAEIRNLSQLHGKTEDFLLIVTMQITWLALLKCSLFPALLMCLCIGVCISVNLSVEGKFTFEYHLHSEKQCVSQILCNSTEGCKWGLDSSLSQIVNSPKYLLFQMNAFGK